MAEGHDLDGFRAGGPFRLVRRASGEPPQQVVDVFVELLHLIGREIGRVVDRKGGLAPFQRVRATLRPPRPQALVDALMERRLQRVLGGRIFRVGFGRFEVNGDVHDAPWTAPAPSTPGLLDKAVLRQGLQVPGHVARAVVEQLGRSSGRQRPFAHYGLEQGNTHGVGQRSHGTRIRDIPPTTRGTGDRLVRRLLCRHLVTGSPDRPGTTVRRGTARRRPISTKAQPAAFLNEGRPPGTGRACRRCAVWRWISTRRSVVNISVTAGLREYTVAPPPHLTRSLVTRLHV